MTWKQQIIKERLPQGPDPAKRFKGAVCPKHMELSGVRHISSGSCVGCQKESNKRHRNPEIERQRHWRFRALDHVNQDGAEEYRQTGRRSEKLWRWLKHHKWPAGYRVLCASCNVKVFRLYQRGAKE